MPLYDFECGQCGAVSERFIPIDSEPPKCCGKPMAHKLGGGKVVIKSGPPLWVDRMDDIHKAQTDRGEKLRFVHPKEIRAS